MTLVAGFIGFANRILQKIAQKGASPMHLLRFAPLGFNFLKWLSQKETSAGDNVGFLHDARHDAGYARWVMLVCSICYGGFVGIVGP